MRYHFHILQRLRIFFERNSTYVEWFSCYRDLFALLAISHERDDQRILAVLDVDREVSICIRDCTCNEVLALHNADVRKVNRFLCPEINRLTRYFCGKKADGEHQKDRNTNDFFHPKSILLPVHSRRYLDR